MTHEEKVKKIAAEIKERADSGERIVFTKKSVSHLVPNPAGHRPETKIYLGDLDRIISIDKENKTCEAEAGVAFFDLVRATLPQGLVPYVVPELKTISIGGAVSGCSIESLSYRYGGFHDNCLEYEIITGAGEIITCSRAKNPDIFEMVHGSYGTLGVLTKLKFKLYPAKPFVKMTYVKFTNFADFWNYLRERCEKRDHEFVDAIIHAPDKFVVCLGEMTDNAPYTSSYEWLKIYYKSTWKRDEDYLTTPEYFFRYDTECHWLSKTAPLLENPLVRLLFGKFILGSTNMIRWSKRLSGLLCLKKRPDVIVDVFIPSRKFPEFYRWYENDFDFFPLWVVPYRMPGIYPWVSPEQAAKSGETFYIDCAIYGKKNNDPKIDYSELLENKIFDLGGVKTLISRNHYSEEKFWQIYNRPNYEAVKQKTDPRNVFGTVYGNMVKK